MKLLPRVWSMRHLITIAWKTKLRCNHVDGPLLNSKLHSAMMCKACLPHGTKITADERGLIKPAYTDCEFTAGYSDVCNLSTLRGCVKPGRQHGLLGVTLHRADTSLHARHSDVSAASEQIACETEQTPFMVLRPSSSCGACETHRSHTGRKRTHCATKVPALAAVGRSFRSDNLKGS